MAYLFQNSDNETIRQKASSHRDFHNSYLRTLVQVGLVGAAFFVAALWLIFKTAWKAYRARWLRRDMFLFTVGALALFLVASMANLRTRDHFGRFHLTLFGGIAYSFRFSRLRATDKRSDPVGKRD